MTALKLETFEITEGGASSLHQFRSDILERERNEAYANGFKDGVNVTKDAVNAEQNRLLAAISEAINDAQLTREQAGARAVKSVLQFVTTMVAHVGPHLVQSEFTQAVAAAISRAHQKAQNGSIRLRVAMGHGENAIVLFAEKPFEIEVLEDPDLSEFEARVDWANGNDSINFDDFLKDLNSVMAEFELLTDEDRDERNRQSG